VYEEEYQRITDEWTELEGIARRLGKERETEQIEGYIQEVEKAFEIIEDMMRKKAMNQIENDVRSVEEKSVGEKSSIHDDAGVSYSRGM
jgi:hypothetical protein